MCICSNIRTVVSVYCQSPEIGPTRQGNQSLDCVHTLTHTLTFTHTHTHTHTNTLTQIRTCTCTHVHVHVHYSIMCAHTHSRIRTCTCTCTCTCTMLDLSVYFLSYSTLDRRSASVPFDKEDPPVYVY